MERTDRIDAKSRNRCQCECHSPGSRMMHMMSCCSTCRFCRTDRIRNLPEHQMSCAEFLMRSLQV